MSRAHGARVGAFAALFLAGCAASSPPAAAQLAITAGSTPPTGGAFDSSVAYVPVGIVLELVVAPSGYEGNVDVSISSDDPALAAVVPMTTPDQFVVIGLAPGNTTLRFFVNGRETSALSINGTPGSTLSVEVSPQPAPQ